LQFLEQFDSNSPDEDYRTQFTHKIFKLLHPFRSKKSFKDIDFDNLPDALIKLFPYIKDALPEIYPPFLPSRPPQQGCGVAVPFRLAEMTDGIPPKDPTFYSHEKHACSGGLNDEKAKKKENFLKPDVDVYSKAEEYYVCGMEVLERICRIEACTPHPRLRKIVEDERRRQLGQVLLKRQGWTANERRGMKEKERERELLEEVREEEKMEERKGEEVNEDGYEIDSHYAFQRVEQLLKNIRVAISADEREAITEYGRSMYVNKCVIPLSERDRSLEVVETMCENGRKQSISLSSLRESTEELALELIEKAMERLRRRKDQERVGVVMTFEKMITRGGYGQLFSCYVKGCGEREHI
jgi:hypothetical protein